MMLNSGDSNFLTMRLLHNVIGLKKLIPFVKVLVSKHPSCRITPPKNVHTNVEHLVEIMHIDFGKKYHLKDDIS